MCMLPIMYCLSTDTLVELYVVVVLTYLLTHYHILRKKTFFDHELNIDALIWEFKHQPHKMAKHTQTIRRQQSTNGLSVFDHFVGLALKGLNKLTLKRALVSCIKLNTKILLFKLQILIQTLPAMSDKWKAVGEGWYKPNIAGSSQNRSDRKKQTGADTPLQNVCKLSRKLTYSTNYLS